MLDRSPDALRADFQRFYGLDLDEVGHSVRVRRAADLAARLPAEARTWQAFDPRAAWTASDWLLAAIADNTGFLAWCKTKDASRRGAKWKGRIPRPGERQAARSADTTAADVDVIRRMLAMPRGMTERTIDHGC